jgi:predicted transcriptional regulator
MLGASLRQFPFGEMAASFSFLVAFGNLALALFNLIPGLPLDGGRMLRAVLWLVSRNFQRSTTWATVVGQVYSILLVTGGLWMIASDLLRNLKVDTPTLHALGNFLLKATGIGWIPVEYRTLGLGVGMVLMGWVLLPLACAAGRQQRWQHALSGTKVWQILPTAAPAIPAEVMVDRVVEHYLLPRKNSVFPIVQEGRLVGLMTWKRVRALPVEDRAHVTAAQVAVPVPALLTVEAEADAWDTLSLMWDRHLEHVVVTGNEQFLGLISQDDLVEWTKRKIDLKV